MWPALASEPHQAFLDASQGEGARAHQETHGSSCQILDPGMGMGQADVLQMANLMRFWWQIDVANKFESFFLFCLFGRFVEFWELIFVEN